MMKKSKKTKCQQTLTTNAKEFDDHKDDIFSQLAQIKTQSLLSTALTQITSLEQLARLMESETTAGLGPTMVKIYAWEIESVAKKLAKLVKCLATEK